MIGLDMRRLPEIKTEISFGAFSVVLLLAACETTYTPLASLNSNIKFQSTEVIGPKGRTLTVEGILSKHDGDGPFPAVVLLHTCGGMRPHVTEDWPRFLNELGYVTLTVDSDSPRGALRCTDLDRNLRRETATRDAYGALVYLSKLPDVSAGRVAVMGFSAGANALNYYLRTRRVSPPGDLRFNAAIGFYGRCHEPYCYSTGDIPAMQIVGEMDTSHAPDCAAVGVRTPMETHILPGAFHAFDSGQGWGPRIDPYGSKMQFNQAALDQSRKLTQAFLTKHLDR